MRPTLSLPFGVLLGGLLLSAVCDAASSSTLPPVRAGLWHVTATTHFEPDPEPGSRHWPGLNKPRVQDYEICLSDWRAAHPMTPPENATVLRTGDDTLTAIETSTDARGTPGRLEWRYRRASDTAFAGARTIALGEMAMTLDYQARFVATECGAVEPASQSKFGEP